MVKGPELNADELKALSKMVELDTDTFIEQKRLVEVPRGCTEGLCDEL